MRLALQQSVRRDLLLTDMLLDASQVGYETEFYLLQEPWQRERTEKPVPYDTSNYCQASAADAATEGMAGSRSTELAVQERSAVLQSISNVRPAAGMQAHRSNDANDALASSRSMPSEVSSGCPCPVHRHGGYHQRGATVVGRHSGAVACRERQRAAGICRAACGSLRSRRRSGGLSLWLKSFGAFVHYKAS